MKRVVVLGGAGNFGARIVRSLAAEPETEVLVAGRSSTPRKTLPTATRWIALDIDDPALANRLRDVAPFLVIHCVGPFQGQDYRVARAAIRCGAHYIDLADGRDFVAAFASANDALARDAGCVAVSGASTLPALSSAVVDHLGAGLRRLLSIDTVIAPGQAAPRGAATLQAVLSYLGRPVRVWKSGRWQTRTGWMDLKQVRLRTGNRWSALCDVPDLALFPERYAPVESVEFRAALEVRVQHLLLWGLAALVRVGASLDRERLAQAMEKRAAWFDRLAGEWGGMRIEVAGFRDDGVPVRRNWELTVPALQGPEIPCIAATLLARTWLRGESPSPGARSGAGVLKLDAFRPEFERWQITTRVTEQVF